jgi:hypothetical protein
MKLRGNDVAIMGTMAALIIVAGYIKLTPVVGATSYQFSMGSVALQLVAVILGPILGVVTAFAGSFAGQFLTGQGGTFPLFVPATVGALVTALLVWGREREGVVASLAVIAIWFLFPVGRELWYYPYVHAIFLAAILAVRPLWGDWRALPRAKQTVVLAMYCTMGLLCDQLTGSILAIPIFNLTADMYEAVLFIYPVERILLGVASALVAVPVLTALEKAAFPIIQRLERGKIYPTEDDYRI